MPEKYADKYAAIGKRVWQRRAASGLTQTEFAQLIGITSSRMSYIERGSCTYPVHALFDVAAALGVPIGELFGDE
jgi:transcriptional regulator with XRE-family HTH domain